MSVRDAYEMNDGSLAVDVTVSGYSHEVGRFGNISNLILREEHEDETSYYEIDESVSIDVLAALIALDKDAKITLISHVLRDGQMTYIPLLSDLPAPVDQPVCYRCKTPLEETLGTLVCPSSECHERVESRIVYFISRSGSPVELDQLAEISQFVQKGSCWSTILVDVVIPAIDTSPQDSIFYGKMLQYMEAYAKVLARALHRYHDDEKLFDDLVKFIMDLSIPAITPGVIVKVANEAIASNESVYLLTRLGAYLNSLDEVKYGRYIRELSEIESRLHYWTYH